MGRRLTAKRKLMNMKTSKNPDVEALFRLDGSLTEDGNPPADAGEVDYIPTDRIPALIALMNEEGDPVQKDVRNQAAIYLAEWGYEEGVKYIEAEVFKPVDERARTHEHRMGDIDITPELFMRALIGYWTILSDQDRSEEGKNRIRPALQRIVKLAEQQPFEINSILYWEIDEYFGPQNLIGDREVLGSYLIAMLDQKESDQHQYKPKKAVEFFEKYDPVFLDQELKARGLTRADF